MYTTAIVGVTPQVTEGRLPERERIALEIQNVVNQLKRQPNSLAVLEGDTLNLMTTRQYFTSVVYYKKTQQPPPQYRAQKKKIYIYPENQNY